MKLKLGIVGFGGLFCNRVLPVLQEMSEYQVIALADVNPDALSFVSNKLKVKKNI